MSVEQTNPSQVQRSGADEYLPDRTLLTAASLDDSVAGSVAGHGSGNITFATDPAITHALTGLTTERSVIAAELHRRNGRWKFRPDLAHEWILTLVVAR